MGEEVGGGEGGGGCTERDLVYMELDTGGERELIGVIVRAGE